MPVALDNGATAERGVFGGPDYLLRIVNRELAAFTPLNRCIGSDDPAPRCHGLSTPNCIPPQSFPAGGKVHEGRGRALRNYLRSRIRTERAGRIGRTGRWATDRSHLLMGHVCGPGITGAAEFPC